MRKQGIIAVSVIMVVISAFVLVSSTRDYSVLLPSVVRIVAPLEESNYLVGDHVPIEVAFDPHGSYQLDPVAKGWEIIVKGDDGSVTNIGHEYSTSYTSRFSRMFNFVPLKAATYTLRAELVIRETYQAEDDPATDPQAGSLTGVIYDLVAGVDETLYYNIVRFTVAEEVIADTSIPETTTDANVNYVQAIGFELLALVLALAAIPLIRRVKKRE